MAQFQTFQIIRSVRDLPPRDIIVFVKTATFDIDLVKTSGVIAIDMEIDNRDAVNVALVTLNSEDVYTISASGSKTHSDVAISRVRVTNSTDYQIIAHVISLALLQKLNAVEVV